MQVSISSITIPPRTPGICTKNLPHPGAFASKLLPGGRDLLGQLGAGICLLTMFAIFEIFIIMARIGGGQHFGVYLLL